MADMQIAEAKARLTIPALWAHFQLRGKPGKCCRCPWRPDRHPSFSVFAGGAKWKDHATGDSGDAVDFYRIATGLTQLDACREFIRLAFGYIVTRALVRAYERPPEPAVMPLLEIGSHVHRDLLAKGRQVSLEALDLAINRGLLRFGNYRGHTAWFVTDSSRKAIQARRLDGGRWWNYGPKALNLPGTTPSWPVGAATVTPFSHVIAVEGGPDLLAAFHFLSAAGMQDRATAVAILGANNSILPDAASLFSQKRIRIVPHRDRVGADASIRWQRQFEAAGAMVDVAPIEMLMPNHGKAKDLNDLCRTPAECQAQISSALIGGFM